MAQAAAGKGRAVKRIADHIWTVLDAYERGHDILNDSALRQDLRDFAARLEAIDADPARREALEALLYPPCKRCLDGLLQNEEDGWQPGLVLTPEAEAAVRAAFDGVPAPPVAVKWMPCPACNGAL